jgi:Rrf2 family transcriptional regulator, cysteine metabolism repressor
MISISSKSRYGLTALLTLAEHYGRGLLQIRDIAARKEIPPQYLEQIFNRLLKAGIVRSVRGSKGGYELADDPARVSVLVVIEVLEGGIALVPASNGGANGAVGAIDELFGLAEQGLRTRLDVSLGSLLLRQQALRDALIYHI